MAKDLGSSLSFLGNLIDLFRDEEAKYSQFHQIVVDLINKKDCDEIIARLGALFNGDERTIMGFYLLFLVQKSRRKKKRVDLTRDSRLISQVVWLYSNNKHACGCFLGTLYVLLKDGGSRSDAYKDVAKLVHDHPKVLKEFHYFLRQAANISHCEQSHSLLAVEESCNSSRYAQKVDEISNISTNHEQTTKREHDEMDTSGDTKRAGHKSNAKFSGIYNLTGFLCTEWCTLRLVNSEERRRFRDKNVDERKKSRECKREKDKEEEKLNKMKYPISNYSSYQRGSFSDNKQEYRKPISQLYSSSWESSTPSYRLIPEELREPINSHRTPLEKAVLNSDWILQADSGSYGSKPKPNKYQKQVFKCEDDMFEFDMLLERVKTTIMRVEERIEKMPDEITSPNFQIQMKEAFTSSNLRCIEQIFEPCGLDVLENIRRDARKALPAILHCLKEREEYLKEIRVELHEVCKDAFAENYPKHYNSCGL